KAATTEWRPVPWPAQARAPDHFAPGESGRSLGRHPRQYPFDDPVAALAIETEGIGQRGIGALGQAFAQQAAGAEEARTHGRLGAVQGVRVFLVAELLERAQEGQPPEGLRQPGGQLLAVAALLAAGRGLVGPALAGFDQ